MHCSRALLRKEVSLCRTSAFSHGLNAGFPPLILIKAARALRRILYGTEAHRLRRTVKGKADMHREHRTSRLQPVGQAFLEMLERDQRRLLRVCAALEKVADGLPESSRQPRTLRVLSFLGSAFERHVFLHEKCLFPLIRSLAGTPAAIEPVLAQLESEHASDHGLVLEITSAFLSGGRDKADIGVHVLGFLLRSFFENYRRHQSWERNILYPVARQHLAGRTVAAQGERDALLRLSLGLAVRSGPV
jgi:iron-sulfur cluster repair protein YtfE (RIC family)